MHIPVTIKETQFIIIRKTQSRRAFPGPLESTGEFYQTFKEVALILHGFFKKIQEVVTLPNSF